MSRSGYSTDLDNWALIKWRGQVTSAIRGARGQAFLRELLAALDAMPEKKLIADSLTGTGGEVCTLGAIAPAKGVDVAAIDPEDDDHRETLAGAFNIAHQLVAEIENENDEMSRCIRPPLRVSSGRGKPRSNGGGGCVSGWRRKSPPYLGTPQ